MLKRLYVNNYRCLVNFTWEPGPVCLLVGPNGSGKSTVFEVLRAVRGIVTEEQPVQEVFNAATQTAWMKQEEQRVELQVEGNGGVYDYALSIQLHDGVAGIAHEELRKAGLTLFRFDGREVRLHDNDGVERTHFPYRGSRSFIGTLEERPETRELRWFRDDFLRRLWVGRLNPYSVLPEAKEEAVSLNFDGRNFSAWYRHISQQRPEVAQQFFDDLRAIIPGIRSLSARINPDGSRSLRLSFDKPARYDVSFAELSEGQRCLILLYAILRAQEGGTLVIDEPDNFLAPPEIEPWLSLASDWAHSGGQLVVASHHPYAVDYLAAAQALLLQRAEGAQTQIGPLPVNLDSGETASRALREALT